jgi:hypothetical protein
MRVQGPWSNEIEQPYWMRAIKIGLVAFRGGSNTKKWQIEAKLTWHHFEGKINLSEPKKRKMAKKESS